MLFFRRSFQPFFSTMFLGAFNDNMFRNALVVMITYHMAYEQSTATMLSFLAMALLMLPYFPFSAQAGELADKIDNAKLFRIVKLIEVVLMSLTAVAFHFKSVALLLPLLFLMGTQSAFFSPLKYAYIPRNLPPEMLLRGNGYVNAGTSVAVMLGAVLGNELISLPHGVSILSGALVLCSILGYMAARIIPPQKAVRPDLKFNFNCFSATWRVVQIIFRDRNLRIATLGLSSFWLVAALYVSQLAPFCHHVLNAEPRMIPALYLLFACGVAIGSLLCTQLNRRGNVFKFLPWSLLLMALFTYDLYLSATVWPTPAAMLPISDFFSQPKFYRIVIDLLGLAACGGFYSVPLNALLQHSAPADKVAQVVGGNNIINSGMIAVGTLAVSALMSNGVISLNGVFAVVGTINLLTGVYLFKLYKTKL